MPITFRPGEAVPRAGNYIAYHSHRLGHPVRIDSETFPWCKRCGDQAKFETVEVTTVMTVAAVSDDDDFRLGTARVASETCA